MSVVSWNSTLSVGHDEMDNQHKKLVELLNKLHSAMTEGQGREIVGRTLTELVRYTRVHFAAEEQVMKMAGYPELESHRELHAKLTEQAQQLLDRFNNGQPMNPSEVLRFLWSWLQDHITQSDKKYGAYIAARGKTAAVR